MNRRAKILLGIADIIFVSISSAIGLGLLNGGTYNRATRFGLSFFLMFATIITTLTVINLLKKDI